MLVGRGPFIESIDEAIARFPSRIAVAGCGVTGVAGASIDYSTVDARARELARELVYAGVQNHEPVIVFTSNLPGDLISLIGVWRAGAVAVPLHREVGPATLLTVLQRTRSRVLVLGEVAPGLELPDGTTRSAGPAQILILQAEPPALRPILSDGALIMFTSGSTGEPKGVVLSRDAFVRKLAAIDSILKFPEGLRSLLVLQLNFAFGQWVSLLTLLRCGTIIVAPKFTAATCLRSLVDERIDQIAVVPTMMRAMLSELRSPEGVGHLARLSETCYPRLLCTGGEPLAEELGRQFRSLLPHTGIADVYGLTETCTSDFILPPNDFDDYLGSIGFPSPGVKFRIVDQATGKDVSKGATGEIEIKSDFIMCGYLDAPELTQAAFRDQYFRTGDLARQGKNGAVYLAGRSNDLIVRGGNKIAPIEVDAAMIQHPEIEASLTTGIPDPLMGERIHTVVVITPNSNTDADALRIWARTKLEKFKIPDRIHFASQIPQGRTGKDDRRALQRWLRDQGLLDS